MNNYEALTEVKNNLETNLESLNNTEHNEMYDRDKRTIENRIKQVDMYLELVDFAQRLESLYDARRKSTDADEAREIDNDINRLVNGNEKYFSARFRSEISRLDPKYYDELKEKYGVSLTSPERFRTQVRSGVYRDENNRLQNFVINDNYVKVVDNRASSDMDDDFDYSVPTQQPQVTPVVPEAPTTPESVTPVTPEVTTPQRDSSSSLTRDEIIQDRNLDDVNYVENYNTPGMSDEEIRRAQEELFGTQAPAEPVQQDAAQAWDPRLTEDQIAEAKSRDIYEPVGPEYEQFLSNLGLTALPTNEPVAPTVETPVQPVIGNEPLLIEDKQMGKDPYTNDKGQYLIEDKQMSQPEPLLIEDKQMNQSQIEDKQIVGGEPKVEDNTDVIVRPDNLPNVTRTVDAPKKIYGRSLESILRSVTLDENNETMDLSKRQRQKITRGKIRVTQNLKNRISHKNFIYNILGATSALIPAVVQTITKVTNKVYSAFHPTAVNNYNKIIENLYNLSDADLEVLRTELTANKATELRSYVSILPLVYNRLSVYIEEKYNTPLREEITELEVELMNKYRECRNIHYKIENAQTEEEKQGLFAQMNSIAQGSVDKIGRLRECKLELAHNLEGGPGAHTFAESAKAVDNNQADRGKFFSRKISLSRGEEFNQKNAEYSDALIAALNAGNDAQALALFGEKEKLEYLSTRESASLAGRISTGNYNWKPMPESVDYGNDPLMGYLFTTMSTIGLVKGVISEIHNMQLKDKIDEANRHNAEQQMNINETNAHNQQANIANQNTIDQVNETGRRLEGRSDDYVQGVNQMSQDSIVSTRATGEYNAGDATRWSFNSEYRELDHASHEHVHEMFDQANASFDNLQKAVASGSVTPAQAVQEAQGILNNMNTSKLDMYNQFLETIKVYAPAHPQHDYVPLQTELENIVTNPQAINNMVDGMVESVNAGHSLQEAVASLYQSFSADIRILPDNIQSMVIPLITQAGITGYLNRLKTDYDNKYGAQKDYKGAIEQAIVDVINDDIDREELLDNTESQERIEEQQENTQLANYQGPTDTYQDALRKQMEENMDLETINQIIEEQGRNR